MKNTYLKLMAIALISVMFFAFTVLKVGSVTGKVTPPDAVKDVWAISASDTVRGSVSQGGFTIMNVKPGTYKVIIDAIEPYKDVVKEGISVTEGQSIDMGEIKLEK